MSLFIQSVNPLAHQNIVNTHAPNSSPENLIQQCIELSGWDTTTYANESLRFVIAIHLFELVNLSEKPAFSLEEKNALQKLITQPLPKHIADQSIILSLLAILDYLNSSESNERQEEMENACTLLHDRLNETKTPWLTFLPILLSNKALLDSPINPDNEPSELLIAESKENASFVEKLLRAQLTNFHTTLVNSEECQKPRDKSLDHFFETRVREKQIVNDIERDLAANEKKETQKTPLDALEELRESLADCQIKNNINLRKKAKKVAHRHKKQPSKPTIKETHSQYSNSESENEKIEKKERTPPLPPTLFCLQNTLDESPTQNNTQQHVLSRFASAHFSLLIDHLEEIGQNAPKEILSDCTNRINLVSNHLFSASQNLENLYEAITDSCGENIPSILSSLLADWHVVIEQFLSLHCLIKQPQTSLVHCLPELAKKANMPVIPLLTNLERGLLWYRYPIYYSTTFSQNRPTGLKILEAGQRANQDTRYSKQDLLDMIDFVYNTQKETYEFLYSAMDEVKPFLSQLFQTVSGKMDQLKNQLKGRINEPNYPINPPITNNVSTPLRLGFDELLAAIKGTQGHIASDLLTSIDEYLLHLSRMIQTFAMCDRFPHPQFASLHIRRMLNFQWMTEQFYNILIQHRGGTRFHNHDFWKFEQQLYTKPLPNFFKEYNVGPAVHYENQLWHQKVPITDLQETLKSCRELALCDEGFEPTSASLARECCLKRVKKHRMKIEQLILQQIEMLKQEFR